MVKHKAMHVGSSVTIHVGAACLPACSLATVPLRHSNLPSCSMLPPLLPASLCGCLLFYLSFVPACRVFRTGLPCWHFVHCWDAHAILCCCLPAWKAWQTCSPSASLPPPSTLFIFTYSEPAGRNRRGHAARLVRDGMDILCTMGVSGIRRGVNADLLSFRRDILALFGGGMVTPTQDVDNAGTISAAIRILHLYSRVWIPGRKAGRTRQTWYIARWRPFVVL